MRLAPGMNRCSRVMRDMWNSKLLRRAAGVEMEKVVGIGLV